MPGSSEADSRLVGAPSSEGVSVSTATTSDARVRIQDSFRCRAWYAPRRTRRNPHTHGEQVTALRPEQRRARANALEFDPKFPWADWVLMDLSPRAENVRRAVGATFSGTGRICPGCDERAIGSTPSIASRLPRRASRAPARVPLLVRLARGGRGRELPPPPAATDH
jgi:hypothetical protein